MGAKIEWVSWINARNQYSKSHAFNSGSETAMCGEGLPKSAIINASAAAGICSRCTDSVSKLRRQEFDARKAEA